MNYFRLYLPIVFLINHIDYTLVIYRLDSLCESSIFPLNTILIDTDLYQDLLQVLPA